MAEFSQADWAVLLTRLLDRPVVAAEVTKAVAQLRATPASAATTVRQLQRLLTLTDDPAWLEALAAYREGVETPEMTDFLTVHTLLTALAPATLTPFALLQAAPPVEEADLFSAMPTFADQWQARQAAAPSWQQGLGYEWQRWQAQGRVVIRWLQAALTAPMPTLATVGVKGQLAQTIPAAATFVRRITLTPEAGVDLDLDAQLWRQQTSPFYLLLVNLQIPSQWPESGNVIVLVTGVNWQAQGVTNDEGEVIFPTIPAAAIETLTIAVMSPRL